MADLNVTSSSAIAEYRDGSVTASRIQPFDGDGTGGYYIGDTYFYQDTMYTLKIDPKTGSTVTVDSIVARSPGLIGGSQIDITGQLSAAPTNIPSASTNDTSGCAIWVSDGTSPYGSIGDVYASKRVTGQGSLSHACLSPFTRLYSDTESGSDATIAADGSDGSLGVSLASLPPGTYWMSYSFTYAPTTAFDDRALHFWVEGTTAGVLPNSVSGHDQASGTNRNTASVSWIQTLTATDTLTLTGHFESTGADTAVVQSTSYPTVFLAVRIA